jgi:glycosyltransferase involved in cell wall biosynthesis
MLKVLHVINGWALGGIAQVTLDLIKNTPNVKHYAIGYCWTETSVFKEFEEAGCVNIIDDEKYANLENKLVGYDIDIVHKQTGGGEFPEWVKVCNNRSVPVVESLHCPRASGIPKEFISATVCTTDYVINKNQDRPVDKIPYPCGLPLAEPRQHPWKAGLKRPMRVGRIARYEFDKLPEVIATTAIFLRHLRDEVEFYIMGYPFNEPLFEMMKVFHNPPFINILGLQENKLESLRKLDICIDPVWETSFDIVMIEAMSQGIPVVTWEDSAAPEVCGKGGLIVTRTSSQLASGVQALIRNPHIYESCSKNAIEKIATIHNPVLYGEAFEKLYSRITQ